MYLGNNQRGVNRPAGVATTDGEEADRKKTKICGERIQGDLNVLSDGGLLDRVGCDIANVCLKLSSVGGSISAPSFSTVLICGLFVVGLMKRFLHI